MSSSLSNLVNNLAADEIKNIFSYECEDCNNKLDYLRLKILVCYLNVFNVIHGAKNSLNTILLINLKMHMNFVIKALVNSYYY